MVCYISGGSYLMMITPIYIYTYGCFSFAYVRVLIGCTMSDRRTNADKLEDHSKGFLGSVKHHVCVS